MLVARSKMFHFLMSCDQILDRFSGTDRFILLRGNSLWRQQRQQKRKLKQQRKRQPKKATKRERHQRKIWSSWSLLLKRKRLRSILVATIKL